MNDVLGNRQFVSLALSAVAGAALSHQMPFPDQNSLLALVWLERPHLFYAIKWAYVTMLFSTPFIGFSLAFSLANIFVAKKEGPRAFSKLPRYPFAGDHCRLSR